MALPRDWPRLAFRGDETAPHGGVNLTIRAGRRWLDLFHAGKDRVVVLNEDGRPTGKAQLVAAYYVPFHEAKQEWLLLLPRPLSLVAAFESVRRHYAECADERHRREVNATDYFTFLFYTEIE